jgi:hypothetical protein
MKVGLVEGLSAGLKDVRLLIVDRSGATRKLAQLKWSNSDASFYIFAYCPSGGKSFAGLVRLPKDLSPYSFDMSGQLQSIDEMTKMSLHESGMAKAEIGGLKTKLVMGRPFKDADNGHIATIICGDPSVLPLYSKPSSGIQDYTVARKDRGWNSCRFPIFIHSELQRGMNHNLSITFHRSILTSPLYVGINFIEQSIDSIQTDGVLVLGGWAPSYGGIEETDLLFTATQSDH